MSEVTWAPAPTELHSITEDDGKRPITLALAEAFGDFPLLLDSDAREPLKAMSAAYGLPVDTNPYQQLIEAIEMHKCIQVNTTLRILHVPDSKR